MICNSVSIKPLPECECYVAFDIEYEISQFIYFCISTGKAVNCTHISLDFLGDTDIIKIEDALSKHSDKKAAKKINKILNNNQYIKNLRA